MTDTELRKAMEEHFGSFGEVCFWLASFRKNVGKVSDNQIEETFEIMVRRHRKCFNKKAFIASCREPD